MLCALSQYLDRNAHVSEPTPALGSVENEFNGDTQNAPFDSTQNAPFDGRMNSYAPSHKTGKKDGNELCMWDSIKSQVTRSLSRNRLPDFSNLKALLVQRKSFRNHFHTYRASKDQKQEKDEDQDEYEASEDKLPTMPQLSESSQSSQPSQGPTVSSADNVDTSASNQTALACSQPGSPVHEPPSNVWRHNRRHLPVPTGPHTVGCVDLMCDVADQGTFFRLYYPTNPTDIHRAYKRWPLWLPRKQYAHGYMYFLKKNTTIFGRVANWLGGDVYAPVLWQAPLLKSDEVFPVIIVSHGIGGNRTTLSTYSYQLASRGFVVAAIEHRDGTASMTLCLKEHLESTIIDSDEADNRSNNNDCITVNNNVKTNSQQNREHNDSEKNSHIKKEESVDMRPPRPNMSEPGSDNQPLDVLLENFCELNQLDERETAFVTSLATDCESSENKSDGERSTRVTFGLGDVRQDEDSTSASTEKSVDDKNESLENCNNAMKNFDDAMKDVDGAKCSPQSQPPQVSKAHHVRSKSYSGIGDGAWVRKGRENKRRSMRHNHSCSEEWRPFQHVEVWDDFDYRNSQMYQRADEISDLLDELISMNAGGHINNALGLAFNTIQFKNRLDMSRVVIAGHSFGGAAALATLVTDERFKVGLCLDSWMHPLDSHVYNNTKQPALFLNMEAFQWEKNVNRMIRFQEANPEADRPMMTLMGGCHQSMTDFQFIVPQVVGRLIDVCYTLPAAQCMSTILDTSLAFMRKHIDLPMEPQDKDILDYNHPHLIQGTNVDLTIPDEGPTPP